MQGKFSKLQERLAQKTAGIERPANETPRDHSAGGSPMTMPGQLGAFRLEAQRYQDTINSLTERVKQAEAVTATSSGKIPLTLIDDSPYQPRIQYDPMEIDNLAHSLAAAGQEEPIKLRQKADERYEIVGSGHRRCRAARSLGWIEIDAIVVDRSDRDAELATMVSNEARVDLTDYERGKLYKRSLTSGFAGTQAEIANLFGTSQGRVSSCLAMLKLPDNYIAMLETQPDVFSRTCAESIAKLLKEYPDETELIEIGVHRIKDGADQKSLTQWVSQMIRQKNKKDEPQKDKRSVVPDRSGREVFTAKFDEDEINIKIKVSGLNSKELKEFVLTALRQYSENI